MARALWLPSAITAAGLPLVRVPGWETRGSAAVSFRGLVCHHTASSRRGGNAPSLRIVTHGRSDLPGPLCQVLLARDGTCYLVAAGRANHAGSGGWDGLAGNSSVMGIEAENDGVGEPWPAVQLDAYRRLARAMNHGMSAAARRTCAHREWTPRKIDPTGIDMPAFRRAIAQEVSDMSAKAEQQIDAIHQMLSGNPTLPFGLRPVLGAAQHAALYVVVDADGARWVTDGLTARRRFPGGHPFLALAERRFGAPRVPLDRQETDLFVRHVPEVPTVPASTG